jgi:hypothetical protein
MLSVTSGALFGAFEQADKHPAIKSTIIELNNFSDFIFPAPFAKHDFLKTERHKRTGAPIPPVYTTVWRGEEQDNQC